MAVNEREVVLDMLLSLREGKLSHTILKDTLDSYLYLDKSSRGFITRLYEGTIEKRLYLDFIIDGYSKTYYYASLRNGGISALLYGQGT